MNFSFYIARRYLFSKKKRNLINLISAISVSGVAVGTMGLIIGLSGFNGFDSLIKSHFSSFDPDFRITINEGKSFLPNDEKFRQIRELPEVAFYTEVIEENALLRYDDRQVIGTVKGVGPDFEKMTGIDTMMTDGQFKLKDELYNYAVMGQRVAQLLSVGLHNLNPVNIYVPQRGRGIALAPEANFNRMQILPSGFFSIQQELDSKYLIVPLDFARILFDMPEKVNAIEIQLQDGVQGSKIQKNIQNIVGDGFTVKNRYQQHDYLYKTMKSEKFAVYLILIMILIIASFNIIGSLTMLIIDKKEDISILKSMGANRQTIRNIFLSEGWSISILGAIAGTVIGLAVCQAQITFGLVKLQGGDSFIVDAYPMTIIPADVAMILLSVVVIGFLAAWFPVRQISDKLLDDEGH